MDSQELEEIAFHQQNGRPETTKGPYYHQTWWESYKGAVKGILGGIVVGGLVGAGVGGAVIGALTLAGINIGGAAGVVLASTTLFGMYEGKEKFEKVGIASGASAAAAEVSEVRMKEYVRGKFTDLTNEIREMKAAIAGKISPDAMHTNPQAPDTKAIFDESDFRSTHFETHTSEKIPLVFWNVATIGALVGAAVAAVAIFAGAGDTTLGHIISDALSVSGAAADTALVATGATLGASFGVNRDIFRKIFDVTDCWFMGISDGKCSVTEIAQAKGKPAPNLAPQAPKNHAPERANALQNMTTSTDGVPTTTISGSSIAQQQTTLFRDKILAEQARNALLSMDHTTAVRH
jgi:hypothetical protein